MKIESILDSAETLCRHRGFRWTLLRRRVLEIILRSPSPLGAYDILAILSNEKGHTAPPTVYRTLDFLLSQGLVHRIVSLSAYLGCQYPHEDHEFQFMICKHCSHVTEIDSPEISQAIHQIATSQGFEVESQTIEISGCCDRCKNTLANGNSKTTVQ